MPINTAKVTSRRQINYKSFDEFLADVDRFSTSQPKTLGNWSAGQIFQHLANAINGSIDGFPPSFPWFVRRMARLFKNKLIHGSMPAGIKMPAKLAKVVMPGPTLIEVGLVNLKSALARLNQDPHRALHPVFGQITPEEWNAIHLKHASLHMSFLTNE